MSNIYTEEYSITITKDKKTGSIVGEFWRRNKILDRVGEPARINYSKETGNVTNRVWYTDDQPSRLEDKPAHVHYDPVSGAIIAEYWFISALLHRDGDRPATIHYDEKNGNILREVYAKNGYVHRSINLGPAILEYDPLTKLVVSQEWHVDGRYIERPGDLGHSPA